MTCIVNINKQTKEELTQEINKLGLESTFYFLGIHWPKEIITKEG